MFEEQPPVFVIDERLIKQIEGLSMVLAGIVGTIVGVVQMYLAHLRKVNTDTSEKVAIKVEEVRSEVTGTEDSHLKGVVTQSAEDIKQLRVDLGRLTNEFAQRVTEWKFEAHEQQQQTQQLKDDLRDERQETMLFRAANSEVQRGIQADMREIQRSINMLNKLVIEALTKRQDG